MFPELDKVQLIEPDGCLLLDYRPHLDARILIGPWQDCLPFHYWEDGHWEPMNGDPAIPLLWPPAHLGPTHAVQVFAGRVPERVRFLASRFWHNQVTILRMMAYSDRPFHMAQHAPVLLWLISEEMQLRGWSHAQVDYLLGLKRVDIVEALYGEDARYLMQSILRTHPEKWDLEELNRIRQAIANRALCKIAGFVPKISMDMLQAINHCAQLAACQRLCISACNGLISTTQFLKASDLIKDSLRMAKHAQLGRVASKLAKCRTLQELVKLHDQTAEKYNELAPEEWQLPSSYQVFSNGTPFPTPPIKGNELIRPIETLEQLLAEGMEMQHCVASYAQEITANSSYIYKVLHPERATLELRLRNDTWVPAQLKLAHNEEPSQRTWEHVWLWLKENAA